ncbi:hypothetical protein BC826DRAFT_1191990 [Russula brevipes]|nr:hypothetical protein BC826DRAFT_1191990 [Russula brevipes]
MFNVQHSTSTPSSDPCRILFASPTSRLALINCPHPASIAHTLPRSPTPRPAPVALLTNT